MPEAGRPSELNEDLILTIKDLFLAKKTWEEIAVTIQIPYKTIEGWRMRNYEGLRDKVENWTMERRLKKAEANIDEILDLAAETTGKLDIKAEMSKFVAETVGKKNYSKRHEQDLTSDGKPITFQVINYADTQHAPVQLHPAQLPASSNDSPGQRQEENHNDLATP